MRRPPAVSTRATPDFARGALTGRRNHWTRSQRTRTRRRRAPPVALVTFAEVRASCSTELTMLIGV